MKGIALDLEKHRIFYEAFISLLTKRYPLMIQENLDVISFKY